MKKHEIEDAAPEKFSLRVEVSIFCDEEDPIAHLEFIEGEAQIVELNNLLRLECGGYPSYRIIANRLHFIEKVAAKLEANGHAFEDMLKST